MIEPAGAQPARQAWGVAALLLAGADVLAARFGAVTVHGELSGLTRAASGHWYFTLKDDTGQAAVLRCAMFRRAAALVDFAAADGQRVELRGRLDVYAARGELQLVVEAMQRMGVGTLYEEFLRLRARLEAAGLFDPARKRPVPRWPRAIGVVTSTAAAALRDVLTTLARRAPQVPVVVYPAPVQGAEAPAALVAALRLVSARHEVDTVLLVRGGGSLEDLWAFNDEGVVRAVAASPLPVVCGVGHETDVTLADLAADLRAATPTAAAELAAPAREDLLAQLAARQQAMARAVARRLQQQAQGLDQRALRMGAPARLLLGERQRLVLLGQRLRHALAPALERRRDRLVPVELRLRQAAARALHARREAIEALGVRLQAVDPRRVLRRGYAWVEDEGGRAIVSARSLQRGQHVRAVWADGAARAQVTAVEPLPIEGEGPPA